MSSQEPMPPYGTPPAPGTSPAWALTHESPPPAAAPRVAVTSPQQVAPTQTQPQPQPLTPAPAPAPGGRPPGPGYGHLAGVGAVRIIGVLVVGLLLAGGIFSVLVQFFTSRTEETTPVTAPVTRLVTDAHVGDIHVRYGAAGQPSSVRTTMHWAFRRPTVSITPADGVLTVASKCPDFWFVANCSVDLTVTVPLGTTLDLHSNTGDITADAQGGDITARTSTGDVRVTGSGAGVIDVRSSTGDVNVRSDSATTRVQAATSTGDVTVRLAGVPTTLSASTSTGDVSVTVPAGHGYLVDASTNTGDVNVSPELRNSTAAERITARSSTGDVSVTAG